MNTTDKVGGRLFCMNCYSLLRGIWDFKKQTQKIISFIENELKNNT